MTPQRAEQAVIDLDDCTEMYRLEPDVIDGEFVEPCATAGRIDCTFLTACGVTRCVHCQKVVAV